MNTHINQLLNQTIQADADSSYIISSDWGQGRATFGGLLGGMMYQAMLREIKDERPLYSFMVSFVGPVATEEMFTIEVKLLRQGRSTIQVEAKIIQKSQIACVALACFGSARESSIQMDALTAPHATAVEELPALPYIPNITPAFTQHIDFRWAFGGIPFSNTQSREMGGWMKLKDLAMDEQFTVAHLITLIDAWPPAILPLLNRPAPASSVTWNIAFIHPMPALTTDWWLYRAEITQAAQGYGQTHAHIWDKNGALIATSSQTVVVFDVF